MFSERGRFCSSDIPRLTAQHYFSYALARAQKDVYGVNVTSRIVWKANFFQAEHPKWGHDLKDIFQADEY